VYVGGSFHSLLLANVITTDTKAEAMSVFFAKPAEVFTGEGVVGQVDLVFRDPSDCATWQQVLEQLVATNKFKQVEATVTFSDHFTQPTLRHFVWSNHALHLFPTLEATNTEGGDEVHLDEYHFAVLHRGGEYLLVMTHEEGLDHHDSLTMHFPSQRLVQFWYHLLMSEPQEPDVSLSPVQSQASVVADAKFTQKVLFSFRHLTPKDFQEDNFVTAMKRGVSDFLPQGTRFAVTTIRNGLVVEVEFFLKNKAAADILLSDLAGARVEYRGIDGNISANGVDLNAKKK